MKPTKKAEICDFSVCTFFGGLFKKNSSAEVDVFFIQISQAVYKTKYTIATTSLKFISARFWKVIKML